MNSLQEYGYWGVALAIGLESMGIPVPVRQRLLGQRCMPGKHRR
jgi:hypothetical protein